MSWTIRRILDWIREDLGGRGVDSARVDSELLVADGLGVKRIQLYLDLDRPLAPEELEAIRERVKRRRAREPIAYILGERDFYGRRFAVSAAVLVPRPDTETLVDRALAFLRDAGRPVGESSLEAAPQALVARASVDGEAHLEPIEDEEEGQAAEDELATSVGEPAAAMDERPAPARLAHARVADLCTGSGCIAITLAKEHPGGRFVATDLSADALAVATANAEALGASVEFRQGDLFAPLRGERFDLLTINPPYLAAAELDECEPEVARHEPRMALVAGPQGDEMLERIAIDAPDHLEPGGAILVEVGHRQAAAFAERLRSSGAWADVRIHRDLAGVERVVEARRPG